MNRAATPFKYWAFISYSHQDEAWAQWLHRALETYRVPRRLVGRPLNDETIPRRLFPIFRDRDELPSSHELGATLTQALKDSRNLIVICSPRSATSRWVNEEIKAFRAMGRSHRVYCLIVDGEPNASGDSAFSECFASALRGDASFEPIAADARERKDGKSGAKLKLISGLIGVGLDELKQREKQRQLRQRLLTAVASFAIVGLLAGSWQWFAAQREAREKEILIEKLVENGRLELLDGRNARAAVYLNEALKLGHDTVPLRYMLGQAMQPIDALTNVRFKHGGTVLRATFSPDGKQVAMAVRIKDEVLGKIYDATTGAEVMQLKNLPKHPRNFQFFPDSKRLFVSGFQKLDVINGYIEEEPVTGIWNLDQEAPTLFLDSNAGRIGMPLHPDGVHFLITGKSGGVEIWDSLRAKKLKTLAAGRTIAACGFSADGTRVLLADEAGSVELWSTEPARRLTSLSGAEGLYVVGTLFFPDGKQALAITDTGDVRIWDLAQSKLRLAYLADPEFIIDARLSSDARRLLTFGRDGYKVWSTSRGLLAFAINKQLRPFATAALSTSGNYLFTADGESPMAEAWGALSKSLLYTLDLHTENLTYVALDRDDRRLLTASSDGYAEIWGTKIKPHWNLEVRGNAPLVVRFIGSGADLFVAGGTADNAYVQRFSDRGVPIVFEGHRAAVRDATLSPDGNHVLTASEDGTARWWDVGSGKQLMQLDHGSALLHLARVSPDGQRAVTADGFYQGTGPAQPPQSFLWEPALGKKIALLAHDKFVYTAAFNHAGTMLATGGAEGLIKLWRPSDGQLMGVLQGHADVVVSLNFSADDQWLLSSSDDKSVRIWNAATGQPEHVFKDPGLGTPIDAIFSPQADRVAISTTEGAIWLWSPVTKTVQVLKGHAGPVLSLRYLHDGQLLLSSSSDGSVRIWDPAMLLELGRAAVNRFQVYSFDVNTDGGLLATVSQERMVGLWNIALEHRDENVIGGQLQCRAPWVLHGLDLAPRAVDPGSCKK